MAIRASNVFESVRAALPMDAAAVLMTSKARNIAVPGGDGAFEDASGRRPSAVRAAAQMRLARAVAGLALAPLIGQRRARIRDEPMRRYQNVVSAWLVGSAVALEAALGTFAGVAVARACLLRGGHTTEGKQQYGEGGALPPSPSTRRVAVGFV